MTDDSLAKRPATSTELSVVALMRAMDIDNVEAIRRLCAGPVEQDPETLAWRRPARPIPDGWRIISPSRN